jgi:AraC family transcriptional regulator
MGSLRVKKRKTGTAAAMASMHAGHTPSLEPTMTTSPENRWNERLAAAALLIGTRLDSPPSLDELADAACISPFHFHRAWRALTGETVGETIARLRIEASQRHLRAAGATVTTTAMDTGFATPQAFARAFRRQTGVSPSAFIAGTAVENRPLPDTEVRVVLREPLDVVALRRNGNDYVAVAEAYGRLFAWAGAADLMGRFEGIYGIALDDVESVDHARFDACVALGPVEPPAEFTRVVLPGGPYLTFTYRGDYAGIPSAEARLMASALLDFDAQLADAPMLHRYLNDPDETPVEELLTELLLPLASGR